MDNRQINQQEKNEKMWDDTARELSEKKRGELRGCSADADEFLRVMA